MTDKGASGPLPGVYERVRSSSRGLSRAEAERRLTEFGPNEVAGRRRAVAVAEFLGFVANPLVLILVLAAVVSAFLGDPVNASIIIVVVGLSLVLNFAQAYRSQRAAERLREEVTPRASALRDGDWVEIQRRELVPGDVIRLTAGDRVPADARLIEARDLPSPRWPRRWDWCRCPPRSSCSWGRRPSRIWLWWRS